MRKRVNKVLTTLPAKEIRWLHAIRDGTDYYITSPPDRSVYHLYQRAGDGFECIAQNQSPALLDRLIFPDADR